MGFSGGYVVINMSAMQEVKVWSLGPEDALGKERKTHSDIPGPKSWISPWGLGLIILAWMLQ